jgi:hypothetical protein
MKRWESQYQRFVVDLRALIRAELLEEDALTRFPGVAAWGMPFVQLYDDYRISFWPSFPFPSTSPTGIPPLFEGARNANSQGMLTFVQ